MNRLMVLTVLVLFAGRAFGAGMVDINRVPDLVSVVSDDATFDLSKAADSKWTAKGVTVDASAHVRLSASSTGVKKIVLKWNGSFDSSAQFAGDAWERAYADLHWGPVDAKRPMPWYFMANVGDATNGYGVMTGPAAMCCWVVSATDVQLTIDVRSGGVGVQLGSRELEACTIVTRAGKPGESGFQAEHEFCKLMCPHPRLAQLPVYGFNDWYCTYGKNTAAGFLKDADYITSLCPKEGNKPYMVVDDGWQGRRQGDKSAACPWDHTNARFGSTMPELAKHVSDRGGLPGLWYRPLEAWPDAPANWRLAYRKDSFDPTVPEVLDQVRSDVTRFRSWGFKLLKHDFSTEEITGQWGKDMHDQVGKDGWSFADKTKTTAEVLLNFYKTIREAAGDDMIIDGCNTIGPLSAGLFELQRVGDDTSGTEWKRTREMGVNCLAFRSPQQGAFFSIDADCAGLAKAGAVPWDLNKQWLDLLARSGTPLFVSWPRRLVGPDQEAALRAALAAASRVQPIGEPVDWMTTRTPQKWILNGSMAEFDWGAVH